MKIEQHMDQVLSYKRRLLLQALGGAALSALVSLRAKAASGSDDPPGESTQTVFTVDEARTLRAAARTLFPHDFLDDRYYAAVVMQLEHLSASPEYAEALRAGMAVLPADFATLDQTAREAALGSLEATSFFQRTRRSTINALYRNPEVWPYFGYPGPSLAFGGWIDKELVDIDWLPEA